MRYLNWDVLIFSQNFKAPLQEFRTTCHVVPDNEIDDDTNSVIQHPRHIAVLSCFVPSQLEGSQFKVSVHSWDPPDINNVQKHFAFQSKVPAFEIRLFIDGIRSASEVVELSSEGKCVDWPKVIEKSLLLDKTGEPEISLQWPKFHEEMLTVLHWNAAENLGRIKVVISEGYKSECTSSGTLFIRLRNSIAFSFQHAPLSVLENCRIAWPNRSMWQQCPHRISPRGVFGLDTLQSQTPLCRSLTGNNEGGAMSVDSFGIGRMAPPPLPGPFLQSQQRAVGKWCESRTSAISDPFVDNRHLKSPHKSDQSDVSTHDSPNNQTCSDTLKFSLDYMSSHRNKYTLSSGNLKKSSDISSSGSHSFVDGPNDRKTLVLATPAGESQRPHEASNISAAAFQDSFISNGLEDSDIFSTIESANRTFSTPPSREMSDQLSVLRNNSNVSDANLTPAVTNDTYSATKGGTKRFITSAAMAKKGEKIKDRASPVFHMEQPKSSHKTDLGADKDNTWTESKRKRSQPIGSNDSRPLTSSNAVPDSEHASPLRKLSRLADFSEALDSQLSTPEGGVKIEDEFNKEPFCGARMCNQS